MKEEIDSTVVEAVIALLNGIEVDGETMEYIINKTAMRDQMKAQLSIESRMPEEVMTQIADDIVADLDNEGVDLIVDQEYGIVHNEISLNDVTYDTWRIKAIVRDVLRSHFTPME
jgi:hypothetical protein